MRTFKLSMIVLFFILLGSQSAVTAQSNYKADWITEALTTVKNGDYPRIKSISYWSDSWEDDGYFVDLTLDSSVEAETAYRAGIADSIYLDAPSFSSDGDRGRVLIANDSGIYQGAYTNPDGEEDGLKSEHISNFEKQIDKDLVWVYFSNNWENGISFPTKNVNTVLEQGALPFIRLMPRSQYDTSDEEIFTLEKIVSGDFDNDLKTWADDAKKVDTPLLLEFGTEVNGNWFSWNGEHHGKELGPQVFIDAYRHIVDLFKAEGLKDTTWFYHVDADNVPDKSWNTHSSYYPGDDYVDWIGVSIYGTFDPSDDWEKFTDLINNSYESIAAISPNKPLAILEFSVNEYDIEYDDGISAPIIIGPMVLTALMVHMKRKSKL